MVPGVSVNVPARESRSHLADLGAVDCDRDYVGGDEDTGEPAERDPDIAADGSLGEQRQDRVHDGGHGLVLGESSTAASPPYSSGPYV